MTTNPSLTEIRNAVDRNVTDLQALLVREQGVAGRNDLLRAFVNLSLALSYFDAAGVEKEEERR